ncbi:DNA-nicking Smr family endonuclease [Thalassospira sp. MBR-102]|uniref:Smr protein n=1 Tax=Thalassospira xiamenensis M-5 = DSM 17429 TaxID=1123366 RepID=A0AB72UIX6_9PROT|nr:Smr/MutS family protein [Thalassospira xiamenensis]AJD54105.1 smr protein [Thalassospira xiamenensis M-5 = DSM 17429]SIS62650.1 DNA-nicking endonuclease, Smr domain [Thalassospira xiamenensis M-5 = DSM 17429]
MTQKKTHKRRRSVSDEEKALWEIFTRDVKPLRSKQRKGSDAVFELDDDHPKSDTAMPLPDDLQGEINKAEEVRAARNLPSARNADRGPQIKNRALAELEPGVTDNIDKSTAKKFQKGQMSIDGRIDLHGMTQDVAHHALNAFIEDSWRAGKRCVLVITGKGSRADEYGRTGLLRQRTPQWLSAPRLRTRILAISEARIQHGGSGAFYVLLKRRRP